MTVIIAGESRRAGLSNRSISLRKRLTAAAVVVLAGLPLLCGAAVVTGGAAWAQEPPLPAGFSESFEKAGLDGWEHSPDAVVRDQVLRVSPGNFAIRWGPWDDFTLALKARYSGSGSVVVRYCFKDEGHYALRLTAGAADLKRVTRSGSSDLGQASSQAISSGEWLDIEVRLSKGRHEIMVGGQRVIEAFDPAPLAPGGVGLHAEDEVTAEFDDLVLTVTPGTGGGEGGSGGVPSGGGSAASGATGATEVLNPSGGTSSLLGLLLDQRDPVKVKDAVINLILAGLFSFILSRAYIHWGASLSNRRRFAANFMLVTITTTFVILVVRSSVALSLGLVGALSIIRFRTAIKDPEELAYLFFAIGLGIGLGDNQRLITILALAAGIGLVGLLRFFRRSKADVNFHLTVGAHIPEKVDLDDIVAALTPHCAKLKLLRFDENERGLEVAFAVEFRDLARLKDARLALRGLSESLDVTFLDNVAVW